MLSSQKLILSSISIHVENSQEEDHQGQNLSVHIHPLDRSNPKGSRLMSIHFVKLGRWSNHIYGLGTDRGNF